MATPVRSILKGLSGDKKSLDIVTFANYPYFDWMLAQVDHRFHFYRGDRQPNELNSWDESLLGKPSNVAYDVNPDLGLSLDANFILCHNRLYQFDLTLILSSFWHLPICQLHNLMPRDMKYSSQWQNIRKRSGQSNIFLGRHIQEAWDIPGYIVNPGIPIIHNNQSKQKKISHIWCGEKEQKSARQIVGAPLDFIKGGDFSSCLILVNSTTNFYPIHVLMAMATGCCVMTPKIPEFETIFQDDVHYIIYTDISDLKKKVNEFSRKPDKCLEIGAASQEKVRSDFSLDKFKKGFDLALKQTSELMYTR